VVAADEKEAGLRATLNLGHTFGHVSTLQASRLSSGLPSVRWLGQFVECRGIIATVFPISINEDRILSYLDEILCWKGPFVIFTVEFSTSRLLQGVKYQVSISSES
jgi:hypothetical protein